MTFFQVPAISIIYPCYLKFAICICCKSYILISFIFDFSFLSILYFIQLENSTFKSFLFVMCISLNYFILEMFCWTFSICCNLCGLISCWCSVISCNCYIIFISNSSCSYDLCLIGDRCFTFVRYCHCQTFFICIKIPAGSTFWFKCNLYRVRYQLHMLWKCISNCKILSSIQL